MYNEFSIVVYDSGYRYAKPLYWDKERISQHYLYLFYDDNHYHVINNIYA